MPILATGTTYVTNDQVTASNLNAAVNDATFASGAVDGATTQLSGGAIIVRDGGVTPAKLSTGGPNWNTGGTLTATAFSGPLTGNVTGNVSGTSANVTGTVAIANGGTGATVAATARTNLELGTIATQAANNVSISGGSITGITDLAIADGGTGASNAAGARTNLLPSYAGNAGKILALNGGATDTEWVSAGGAGTVTSVAVSGGTTGLSTSGGPITSSGTITLAGTLAIANGGTGATSAGAALSALGAYAASNPSGFTSNTGTVTSVGVSGADGIGVASSPVTTSGTIALTLGSITPDDVTSTGFVQGSEYRVSGTKVLGAQAAAEANASVTASYIGSDTVDLTAIQNDVSEVATKLNNLLAKLRTHGIIAT
jgi:hypothetical protein